MLSWHGPTPPGASGRAGSGRPAAIGSFMMNVRSRQVQCSQSPSRSPPSRPGGLQSEVQMGPKEHGGHVTCSGQRGGSRLSSYRGSCSQGPLALPGQGRWLGDSVDDGPPGEGPAPEHSVCVGREPASMTPPRTGPWSPQGDSPGECPTRGPTACWAGGSRRKAASDVSALKMRD